MSCYASVQKSIDNRPSRDAVIDDQVARLVAFSIHRQMNAVAEQT